jgi:ribosomal protein L11 methyltransferase
VAAVDTDPLAGRATAENGRLNGFGVGAAGPLQVAVGSVETLAALLEGRPADLLLCNILAPVIEALAPSFHTVLAPAGVGLLSGLLVEQAAGLQGVLAACGWDAQLRACEGSWGLLQIRRASTGIALAPQGVA